MKKTAFLKREGFTEEYIKYFEDNSIDVPTVQIFSDSMEIDEVFQTDRIEIPFSNNDSTSFILIDKKN